MFACARHWRALPQALKSAIWREYKAGQEISKTPSWRYIAVQRRAVGWLAFKANDEAAARACAPYMIEAEIWRQRCIDAGDGDPLDGLPGGKPFERIDEAKAQAAIIAIRAEQRALGEL